MRVRIGRCGDILAVHMPKTLATRVRIDQGTAVAFSVHGGKLIINRPGRADVALNELLEKIPPENLQTEFETGPAVGAESP
jgi:antitoxin component of MazEF toxin-antitoxin module